MSFASRVVVVTGASRGIGKGIATAFAEAGARVAVVATTVSGAEGAAKEIGNGAIGFECDVSSVEAVEKLFADVVEKLGVPSVVVNNAGITRDTLILRMKDEDWSRVIDVNLTGAFYVIRAAVKPMMRERYGRIINISSVVGNDGAAGQANYAAAKAGLVGLTKTVAKEFGSRGITCNAVAPGFIETDMTHDLAQEFKDTVIKSAPMGRLGTPEDIAAAVLFLASEEAGYITGQVLTVDGGLTI